VFAAIDGYILPIMEKLNSAELAVRLDRTEAETLIVFLAFQLVRTPAFETIFTGSMPIWQLKFERA